MDVVLPILVALGAWWLSTVVIIYRAGMPAASYRRTLGWATVGLLLGAVLIGASRADVSPAGAYLAFVGALAVWAWHEVSYLFGFVSGPRPEECPPDCRGWRRFVLGVKTCIYHELAVIATAAIIAAATWGAPNRVALGTFVILWLMRWSAKLNIFLGVRNLHVEFWPEHLGYLRSFVRQRSMNELFPLSIILATLGIAMLVSAAVAAGPGTMGRTGAVLLATLLSLAMVEHWLLMVRVPDERLWGAGLRSRRTLAEPAEAGPRP